MDVDAFLRWALDDARTLEERYTTELLVEDGVESWHSKRGRYEYDSYETRRERERQRTVNPAYQPHYTADHLRQAAEYLVVQTNWYAFGDRPIRDLTVLRFLPELSSVQIPRCEVLDLSPLADVPKLAELQLGSPGHPFGNPFCLDFRPLARCRALRTLKLGFNQPWPDLRGLETLDGLRELVLGGNLLAFPPGLVFPRIRRGALHCHPLSARTLRDFPVFPACEFLELSGFDQLEGIEAFPRLRNLTLNGDFRDFAPLAALENLTSLTVINEAPEDLRPLLRLPRLQRLSFQVVHGIYLHPRKPRDYSPLADAPALRELEVTGCPPVETEVAAIQAGLPPWDDVLLAPTPRPIPPLRMIVAEHKKWPKEPPETDDLDAPELPDPVLADCDKHWRNRTLTAAISAALGHGDWGSTNRYGHSGRFNFSITSFDVVEKLPLILDAARRVLAAYARETSANFTIRLEVPPPEDTPAQKELIRQFRDAQDEAHFEQMQRDREQYLENLHRFELQKQSGQPIDPAQFDPEPSAPAPLPPWHKSDDEDDDAPGDLAVKQKPEPPPSWRDHDHPLAEEYHLSGELTLGEVWFTHDDRALATYLLRRSPDFIIPEEEPPKPKGGGAA